MKLLLSGMAALMCGALALTSGAASAQTKRIAIAGWGPHPTLAETIEGVKEGLAKEGFKVGANLVLDESHVNFDRSLIPQMLTKLSASNPDLMITIATPVSMTAAQALRTRSFPIVFTPVADPVHVRLVPSWAKSAPLMTGSSNMPDFDATLVFFKQLLPNLKRLAFLYDTGDDSSAAALESIQQAAKKANLEIVPIGVDNPSEIPQRVQSAVGRADAMMPAASGRIQAAIAAISATAGRASLPLISNVPQPVLSHQTLAAYSVSWRQIGEAAGVMSGKILKGAKAEDLPPWKPTAEDHRPMISGKQLEALKITLPEALKSCNCVVQ
jgi:putative tryptophan/tyrosine transport system substrate-binding protein